MVGQSNVVGAIFYPIALDTHSFVMKDNEALEWRGGGCYSIGSNVN
jgi:hypothetical protein